MLKTILSILFCCFTVTSIYGQQTANQVTDYLHGKWDFDFCYGGIAGSYSCPQQPYSSVTFQKLSNTILATKVFNNGVLVYQDILTISTSDPLLIPRSPVDPCFAYPRLVYTYRLWSLGANSLKFAEGCCDNYDYYYNRDVNFQFGSPCLDSLTLSSNADICNNSIGQAEVQPYGGTPPFTYSWSNGVTTAVNSNLPSGIYNVIVIDSVLCIVREFVEVTNTITFDSLTLTANTNNCYSSLSSVSITPIGGTMPYTYSWSNGDTSANITGLSDGTYSVTVVDSNFCAVVDLVTINLNISPLSTIIDLVNDRYLTCGLSCINLSSNTPNGSGPYNYIWSTGANSKNISVCPTATTNYYLTVTDSTGCILSDTATVVVSDTLCESGRVTICKTLRNRQFNYCIDTAQLAYNLSQGATLGCCSNAPPLQQGPGGTGGIFSKVYPNPFTLKTTIEFSSPHSGMVTIEIFNTLGQRIAELFSNEVEENKIYQAEFYQGDLPNGVYIAKISFNKNRVQFHKLFIRNY